MPDSPALTAAELIELTGCEMPAAQLRRLREVGFWLAWRAAGGRVVLPRAHYLAVCAGARPAEASSTGAAIAPQLRPDGWVPRARRHHVA